MFSPPYVQADPDTGELFGLTEFFGFQEFSAAQKIAARSVIALWDDIVAYKFVETTADKVDIAYGNYTNQPETQAYAYLPYDYGDPTDYELIAGDVWVNGNEPSNLDLNYGDYGPITLIHETGHAIGWQHPGAYNAAPGLSITYAANAGYYQDSRQYTVMSYFGAENTGAAPVNWANLTFVYAQTPLIHDIAVAQKVYGADMTTRSGDTVYGFNSTADRQVYDFTKNKLPWLPIWDGGGNDTLDLSGFASNSTINLAPGSFSSGGGSGVVPLDTLKAQGILPASYTQAQYDALRARYNGSDGLLHDNISIAYGAIIENAVGGAGNDTINGNAVANLLTGNAGNDAIHGLGGAGRVFGGTGTDTLFGDDGADYLYGGAGADVLDGGADDDVLYGDDGNDVLTGGAGNDQLTGGLGADAMRGGVGNDTITFKIGATGGVGVDLSLTVRQATGQGNDQVRGFENLEGTSFADTLFGDAGANQRRGLEGNDTLRGRGGADDLTGGTGADSFVFDSAATTGVDRIRDFASGVDKLVFYTADGYAANAGVTFGTTAVGAGAQFVYDDVTDRLWYDADGLGGTDQILLANLATTSIVASDIVVHAGSIPAI